MPGSPAALTFLGRAKPRPAVLPGLGACPSCGGAVPPGTARSGTCLFLPVRAFLCQSPGKGGRGEQDWFCGCCHASQCNLYCV